MQRILLLYVGKAWSNIINYLEWKFEIFVGMNLHGVISYVYSALLPVVIDISFEFLLIWIRFDSTYISGSNMCLILRHGVGEHGSELGLPDIVSNACPCHTLLHLRITGEGSCEPTGGDSLKLKVTYKQIKIESNI